MKNLRAPKIILLNSTRLQQNVGARVSIKNESLLFVGIIGDKGQASLCSRSELKQAQVQLVVGEDIPKKAPEGIIAGLSNETRRQTEPLQSYGHIRRRSARRYSQVLGLAKRRKSGAWNKINE